MHRSGDDRPFEAPAGDARTIRIGSMSGPDPDALHWAGRTPQERLAALEACREAFYGRDAVRGRLARVLEIARQSRG